MNMCIVGMITSGVETLKARVEQNMESSASKFCSEWKLADTGNNGFVCLGNITDEYAMRSSPNSYEEIKQDKDNGFIYKVYTMSEMPNRICMFI